MSQTSADPRVVALTKELEALGEEFQQLELLARIQEKKLRTDR